MNEDTGSYGRWVHLACWRVPSKVWLGFPPKDDAAHVNDKGAYATTLRSLGDMLLSGFDELPDDDDQDAVLEHVMNRANWARLVKPRKKKITPEALELQKETTLVPTGYYPERKAFVVPVPGRDGAIPDALAGKTFVLSGTFPEVGGGKGLNLGKDRVKAMIEAFGGRVTSAVSGKTSVLVVGKEPGFSKIDDARSRGTVQLVNLKDLTEQGIFAGQLEGAPPAMIQSFSSGYGGNGLAAQASAEQLAIAAGFAPAQLAATAADAASKKRPPVQEEEDSKPAAKKPKKKKAAPAATKKQTKKKKTKPATNTFKINCDGCGVDCSAKSWFVAKEETDWCEACVPGKENGAVLQINGVDAPAIEQE